MGEKAVTRNPTGNPVEQSWKWLTQVNPWLNRRQEKQANAGLILHLGVSNWRTRLAQNGKGYRVRQLNC